MAKPRMVVLAGPNGAGKSTIAASLLNQQFGISEFVNADVIAAGLSAFAPEEAAFAAGRIMLRRIEGLLAERRSFAFETTLSSRTPINCIRRATALGYRTTLVYIALPSAQLAAKRVASRVKAGGHAIPVNVIHRRFHRSVNNLIHLYRNVVSDWFVYDNSTLHSPALVAFGHGKAPIIWQTDKWQQLEKIADLKAR